MEYKGYINTDDWTQNASARDASPVTLADLRSIGQQDDLVDMIIGAEVTGAPV